MNETNIKFTLFDKFDVDEYIVLIYSEIDLDSEELVLTTWHSFNKSEVENEQQQSRTQEN